jgi:hypothetical protein
MPPEVLFKGLTRAHAEASYGVSFKRDEAMVPYFNRGGTLYREKIFSASGRPLYWAGPNKDQIPYGLETLALGGTTAFVTEGEGDAMALRAEFPRNPVLGLPGASSWRPAWASYLEDFPVIYLSFDADPAGVDLLNSVWPYLPWARRVKLPEGRDTRDVLQLYGGGEEYERLLQDADRMAGCTRRILSIAAGVGT